MDMDVHARLARGAADVHADVVSIRRMPRMYEITGTAQQLDHRCLLQRRHFEEVRDMPPRYYDDMARTQRICLCLCVRQLVLYHDRLRMAELAEVGHDSAINRSQAA